MRTTLTLDDDIAAEIEQLRRRRGVSLKAAVNETLRAGLREVSKPAAARQAFQTPTFDLGELLVPSIDNVAEVLAVAEGEDFR
jgi:Arc/MetJ family transcription regulator